MAVDLPDPAHRAPEGVDDATVEALGRLSEALETVERARGHLYAFHQLTGTADFKLGDAVDLLRGAGHEELATRLRDELLGRNVLAGRWTFEVVEAYDDDYWSPFRDLERAAREELVQGRRHLHEARMKQEGRTTARPCHPVNPHDP